MLRESLEAVLPPLLLEVTTAPFRVGDWKALDPLGRAALAEVAVALGIVLPCDAGGAAL